MNALDCNASPDDANRCNDSSNKNIASPPMAECTAIMGICKIETIESISIEVNLAEKVILPRSYTFSCP